MTITKQPSCIQLGHVLHLLSINYLVFEIANMTCDLIHSAIASTHLKRMSTLDSSWVVSAGANGLAAHNSPSWLGLYLSVCKLLDLSLALPAHKLPQFQMYRWAFVSEGMENNNVDGLEANQLQNTKTPHSLMNGDKSETIPNADKNSSSTSTNCQKQLYQQDFVPYVVRVARLLLQKV